MECVTRLRFRDRRSHRGERAEDDESRDEGVQAWHPASPH